jgi:hypothetical protein
MARNVNDIIKSMSGAERKKVEARAAQLIADEMTPREVRKARKLTKQKSSKALRVRQEGISGKRK